MKRNGPQAATLYTPAGKRKYLTRTERTAFIAAAELHPRPEVGTLCLLIAYTGCRLSEALAVTARAIEPDAGFVALHSLKKRTSDAVIREVPIPDGLLDRIERVHAVSRLGADERLWRFSRCRAWQLVKEVIAQAGISKGIHATPKGLRHGFGINAVQSDVPLTLVQRWLGHARLETTAIYLNATGAEERALAARMWEGRSATAERFPVRQS